MPTAPPEIPPPRRGDRLYWLRRIHALDPETDHQEIYRISAGHEFPWDYNRALELALFRTFCVPSISALLDATGEFAWRPQKRYEDTGLLMAEIAKNGYDSPRGKESLRSINRMHGRYAIPNDDMLYVLSTFVYEPVDWIDTFGWRRLSHHERRAAYHYYREVGLRMGIREIPGDYTAFRRFKTDYEHAHFRYADTNARVGRSTLNLVRSWFPRPARPLADAAVRSLLNARTREAFGFAAPPGWVVRAVETGLRARAAVETQMPPRRTSRLATEVRSQLYPGWPHGYDISDLGAEAPEGIGREWLRDTAER
ncbi:oxygenase MpaB family protein [Halostreptopolyspora alba]|uniref:DUF2236 domain-containing protein n=1 Tax=Halostreptopolyspora alba TaxID=2487137 RepID=A0A3N0E335_9ACTN|nr:DUF2236 domain-containing protein [Nocardiopsaceae bacterium YIM 96095]